MSGESILVVDDSPVNLKLGYVLLRKEGFTVHTAGNGNEALALLRTFRPDMMLVDIQMPGMNGLELTRRVRKDAVTRDMVVVALTACARGEDEKAAKEAGCDGYITKPVTTATLGSQVREYLNRKTGAVESAPVTPPPSNGLSFADVEVEGLRRRFLEEGLLQSRQLLECLNTQFDSHKAAHLLHMWIGTAGMLGYSDISRLARQGEECLATTRPDMPRLRETLSDLVYAFGDPPEAAPSALPDSVAQTLAGKSIAILGFASEEGDRICAALEAIGARPRVFEANDAPSVVPVEDCSAIVFHVRPETMASRWIAPDSTLDTGRPLILVGRRADILAVDNATQARASDMLIDCWQPEEALMRLSFTLSRAESTQGAQPANKPAGETDFGAITVNVNPVKGTPEILIADDDPVVRSAVRVTLEEYGMHCRVASTGTEALQMARTYRPHGLVLDVNMPGMDGYMVLAAIRQEKLPVRVVLLTARRHENDISRGFTLDADDYIVKPFNLVELVARVRRLLRR